jgi:dTDP-4-dehydrorhamnose 3,5-epimerase
MKIEALNVEGLFLVTREPIQDRRGLFERMFCQRELKGVWGGANVVQVNHSITHAVGAVRGLHYQRPPFSEKKMVQCLRGRVMDYVVDLRAGSATFLKVISVELSARAGNALVIPEGFAHGFQVLEPDSELLYFHSEFYRPESEAGVNFLDPAIKLNLVVPISEISDRDANFMMIGDSFKGLI